MLNLYLIALLSFFVFFMAGDLLIHYLDTRKRSRLIHAKIAEFGGAYHKTYESFIEEMRQYYKHNREKILIYGYSFLAFFISYIASHFLAEDGAFSLFIAFFFSAMLGLYIFLKTYRESRRKKVLLFFPEFIDLLILCVQAGMTIEDAMLRISKQKDLVPEAFVAEIEKLISEMRFSSRKHEAYEKMAARLKDPFIDLFTQMMIHSLNHGTPVLASLKNIIHDHRQEKVLKLEEKASKMPVLMTIPLILFILPTIFIVILGPSIINLFDVLGAQGF